MTERVYQVVLFDNAFDHCYKYLDVHRTRDGAVRDIKDMGYQEVYIRDSERDIRYMKSDRFKEGGTYRFSDVFDEPEALIEECELRD